MDWTYAPAPESVALANLKPAYRPFVGGAFVDGGGEALKTLVRAAVTLNKSKSRG